MKNRCLNAACDCSCEENFCSTSCQQEVDIEVTECNCEHSQCALDKVPLPDDEPDNQSVFSP